MSEKDKNSLPLIFLIFLAVIFGVAGLFIYQYWNYFCNGHISCSLLAPTKISETENSGSLINNLAYWGQTGDFFGGILNPFLTFVGLIFVIMTIKQNEKALKQNQEALELSKTELQLSREELKKSSEALQEQVKTAELQRFENTFFQLIQLHNEIKTAICISDHDKNRITGRAAIRHIFSNFIARTHHSMLKDSSQKPSTRDIDYDLFYQLYHPFIGHYFRNIYQILKFIDDSTINDKKFYTSLLRSQLSSDELGLLFFNCVSSQGEKIKSFIEKYSFFEQLPLDENITKELAMQFNPTAFGDNPEWKKFLEQKPNNQ